MKDSVRNVVTLTLITLVAGLLLGFVYELTKQPIADMELKTKQEACRKVFESAASFDENGGLDISNEESVLEAAGISGVDIDEVLPAYDEAGNVIGYCITATSHEGYGGDIEITMGIDSDGQILGVEILSISETAGLGMKAQNEEFRDQFKNKTVSKFTYTKSGAAQDDEIDALSGATITTKAFTNAVNAGLAYFASLGGAE